MGKKKSEKPRDPQAAARLRRVCVHVSAVVLLLAAAGIGYWAMRRHVDRRVVFSRTAPKVVLVHRPVWMSDALYDEIVALAQPYGAHSAFDRELLHDVADLLGDSPWIKRVHEVRRVYGQRPGDTILVDCEYRAPVALVHWGEYYWLVDGEGVKLPQQYTAREIARIITGRDGKTNIRVVEGVRHAPVEKGERWPGEDLVAGLDLAKCLYGLPYADEVTGIDVANYAGRVNPREAHLVLQTKRGTEIRWGRPLAAKDFFIEVSTAQKLKSMQQVWQQFGRVDANRPWIDIRFDKITYPSVNVQSEPARREPTRRDRAARGAAHASADGQ